MRTFVTVLAGILALALVSVAFGDGGTSAETAAGDDTGGGGDDQAAAARTPMDRCKAAVAQAQEMMTKGKNTRGQGLMWQDKEMIASGTALYEKGEKALDEAKNMSPECAKYIADLEQAQAKPAEKDAVEKKSKPREGRY